MNSYCPCVPGPGNPGISAESNRVPIWRSEIANFLDECSCNIEALRFLLTMVVQSIIRSSIWRSCKIFMWWTVTAHWFPDRAIPVLALSLSDVPVWRSQIANFLVECSCNIVALWFLLTMVVQSSSNSSICRNCKIYMWWIATAFVSRTGKSSISPESDRYSNLGVRDEQFSWWVFLQYWSPSVSAYNGGSINDEVRNM
jgi:hypothetical protein